MEDYFSNPLALWLIALAPIIVLLHTLKFRPRALVVPSLRLWRESIHEPVANAFWQRIRRWPEMIMQLLALTAFILAAAGFKLPGQGEPPREMLIVLDNSASMRALTEGGETRFEAAKRYLIDELENASSHDRFGLALLGAQPRSLVPAGSTPDAIARALADLEPELVHDDPSQRTKAILSWSKWLAESAGLLYVTGPISSDELGSFPAKISLKTVGEPIDNRGIVGAQFIDEGDSLKLELTLSRSSAVNEEDEPEENASPLKAVPVILEELSADGWRMRSTLPGSLTFPKFDLGSPPSSPIRLRARFEIGDAFPIDDVVELLWEPKAELTPAEIFGGQAQVMSSQANEGLLEFLRALGMSEAASEREGELPAQRLWLTRGAEDSDFAPPSGLAFHEEVSGVMTYAQSEWWQDLVYEDFGEMIGVRTLKVLDPAWMPLLYVQGRPVALSRKNGDGTRSLCICEDLFTLNTFLSTDTGLTLISRWFASNRELLHPRAQGAVASVSEGESRSGALLSPQESAQVSRGSAHDQQAELPPGKGEPLPLELANWLMALGLGLIALEWLLAWRKPKVRASEV